MGEEGWQSDGWGRREERKGREAGRRKREIDRGESRVRQAPRGDSSLHELGWVRPPPLRSPPSPPRPGQGGLVGSYIWGGDSGCWGRKSFLGHFTSTSTEIERADIALDPRFKN